MKKNLFYIVLWLCVHIAHVTYASDQPNLNFIDERIFLVSGTPNNMTAMNNRIASPYSTSFLNNLSDNFVVIEPEVVRPLCENAIGRIGSKMAVEKQAVFTDPKWKSCMSKLVADAQLTLEVPNAIRYATMSNVPEKENKIVLIPEKKLFTLLQYSYGIKHMEGKTEILLNFAGTETIIAKPMLITVLNKYRSIERW